MVTLSLLIAHGELNAKMWEWMFGEKEKGAGELEDEY